MFTLSIKNKLCPVWAHGIVSPSALFHAWNTLIPRDRAHEVTRVIKEFYHSNPLKGYSAQLVIIIDKSYTGWKPRIEVDFNLYN